ncbi:MAG: YchF family ATPase [Chloroflexi bacterium]|nr:YchF family ATPase [Chloroflexota bacterium]GIW12053.1 MAG: ribosome-binding ATPase YchF [Dehalococcoidia bacterium]
MYLAVFGQPLAGKSTVYEALTGAVSDPVGSGPALATVKVPDPRLDRLIALFRPKRTVPADVAFADVRVAGTAFSKHAGLAPAYVERLAQADALLLVVRAFPDESVPHLEGSVNAWRDLAAMEEELTFTDQLLLAKRLERISELLGKVKPAERESMERERVLLQRLLSSLERGLPIRDQALTAEERKLIRHYRFLTEKPLLVVLNLGEEQLAEVTQWEAALQERLHGTRMAGACIAGKIERELVQLEEPEAQEFRQALGIAEPARARILRTAYRLLGLISFFTVASNECRAWTIPAGTLAPQAAGAVHSDMERGFIRAEVVHYDDLVAAGSFAEARRRGLVRSEGKQYVVQDGDVIEYLFNV